jgi:nucleolar complex protein 2
MDDDDDNDEEEVYDKKNSKKSKKSKKNNNDMIEIDNNLLNATIKKAVDKKGDGNFTALKKLLSMFRAACIPSGATSKEDEDDEEPTSNFLITSPEVYEQVMVACLENAYITMYKILDIKKDAITPESLSKLKEHPKLKKIQLQILSFFKSILHTLVGLHDADAISKQGRVCVYLISSLEPYIPLLAPLPRLAKGVLKVLLKFWASGIAPIDDTANVRGHAFLRIRQMAISLPGSITEECYRIIYLTYARQCKSFSELNSTSVLFMAQCITELYSYNIPLAYQQSFLYIRQLALHLRSAILKKSNESVRTVTNWQFLNCIRLWTRVICAMPNEDQLGALSFPLVQIILGIIQISTSLYLLPLNFHLITCLHQLAASTNSFIPTASKLIDILTNPDLLLKQTPSTAAAPKIQYMVKYGNDTINSAQVRDSIVNEVILLLRQEFEIYRYHVGLPEYSYLIIKKLKLFIKKCKIPRWKDLCRALCSQLEQYVVYAKKHRTKLGIIPKNIESFEPLLPAGTAEAFIRLKKLLVNKGTMNSVSEVTLGNSASNNNNSKNRPVKSKSVNFYDDGDDNDELPDDEIVGDVDEEDEEESYDENAEEDDDDTDGNDKVGTLDWSDSD